MNMSEYEERFRSSLVHSPLPVLMYDDREQILAVSQSWLEKTGYSNEEVRRLEDWTTRAYGERSGEVLEHMRRIISTEPQAQLSEMTIRTKTAANAFGVLFALPWEPNRMDDASFFAWRKT